MSDPFSTDNEVRGFLSGGSIAAKWPKVGAVVEGDVLSYRMSQQTHMKSGEPLFWEARQKVEESKLNFASSKDNPAMQLLLELACEPTGMTWETNQYIPKRIPDDDGVRTAYVSGGLQKALTKALRDAENAQVEKGAHVKIIRGDSVKAGDFMAYSYTAEWTPAADNGSAANKFLTAPAEGEEAGNPFE